jgi:hypothetical protein
MAHYAFLDENNIVTEVIVGVDETELIEGLNPETWYGNFKGQVCKRTSYNTTGNIHTSGGTPLRGNYASKGYKYDEEFDVFIPPKTHPSWKLDYTTFSWKAPIEKPNDIEGYAWIWSEANLEWAKIARPPTEE